MDEVISAELRARYGIPDADWLQVHGHFRLQRCEAGDTVVRSGEAAREVGFVRRGLFRIFYLDPEGRESTKAFRAEGEMIAAYAEILAGIPSRSTIEAIESSEVYWIPFDRIDQLARSSLFWSQLLRSLAERHFLIKDDREWEFLSLSASERLERFEKSFPHHRRIPRYMVASYLGITPVALSRLSRGRTPRAAPKR